MRIDVLGRRVFEPDDLAILRRAFALATNVAGAAGEESWARDLMARSLFADYAAGERDAGALAHRARGRLAQSLPRLAARCATAPG